MIPKGAAEIPELNQAYKIAEMNAWTEEELEIYDYWQIRDAEDHYKNVEEFEKGLEKGIEKGIENRNIEIAIEMIKDGKSNDKIRKYTGLTEDEINGLRKNGVVKRDLSNA